MLFMKSISQVNQRLKGQKDNSDFSFQEHEKILKLSLYPHNKKRLNKLKITNSSYSHERIEIPGQTAAPETGNKGLYLFLLHQSWQDH